MSSTSVNSDGQAELDADAQAEWMAVTRGKRDIEEVSEARRLAGDSPEDIERARELFRPLDETEHGALLQLVRARQPAGPTSPPSSEPVSAANKRPRRYWIAAVLALASALALWWIAQDPKHALPAYDLVGVQAGIEVLRSDSGTPSHRYTSDTPFEWRLVPSTAVEGAVDVRMFAFPTHGPGRELELGSIAVIDPKGVVVLRGPASSLGLQPGRWMIVIVVAHESTALPDDLDQLRVLEDSDEHRVAALDIVIVED